MERIDPAKAAAVWQRVHITGQPRQDVQSLLTLIQDEVTDGIIYLQLSRQLTSHQALLRQMFQQEQSHAACLKGIYTLITGQRPVLHSPKLTPEAPEASLRRCYGREMHCLAQYEARSSDPEYGMVFSQLARQEQEHCRYLLELLGSLKNK